MTVAREIAAAAELAQELAVWAMDQMLPETIARWDTKAHAADVVTDLDLSIERHVREEISRRFPHHAIIGEEYDERPGSGFTWYCDPVDGTTNFAHGIGWHSFSLAMADEQGPLVGVLADPRSREMFSAVRGEGARLGDRLLHVTPRQELGGAVLMTELLATDPWPGMMTMIPRLARERVTTRIMGSSALSLASIAAGRGHAGIIGRFGRVDLAAAVLILREAGVQMRDEHGAEAFFPDGGGFLAAVPGLTDTVHALWREAAGNRPID